MNEKSAVARETQPVAHVIRIRRSSHPLLTTAGVAGSHGAHVTWGTWRRRTARGGR